MTTLCFRCLVAPALALGLMAVAAGAQSVDVSHDKRVDFSAYKTYALGPVKITGDADPVLVQRLMSAVDARMSAIGFRKVDRDPDVVVATEHWRGISYPYWWSHRFSDADVRRRFVGKVVLEMIEPRTGKVVFRGTAEDSVSPKARTNEKKADEAVREIFAESPWGSDFDDD